MARFIRSYSKGSKSSLLTVMPAKKRVNISIVKADSAQQRRFSHAISACLYGYSVRQFRQGEIAEEGQKCPSLRANARTGDGTCHNFRRLVLARPVIEVACSLVTAFEHP
jgi:hypothetical protein